MQVLEFSQGWLRKRYALSCVVACEDASLLVARVDEAMGAVGEWAQRRGNACGTVQLVFSIRNIPVEMLRSTVEDRWKSDPASHSLPDHVRASAAVLGRRGKADLEFDLAHPHKA